MTTYSIISLETNVFDQSAYSKSTVVWYETNDKNDLDDALEVYQKVNPNREYFRHGSKNDTQNGITITI